MNGDYILRTHCDDFLFLALPLIRVPKIHFTRPLSEEEDFILQCMFVTIGLFFWKQVTAAQDKMITDIVVFDGVAIRFFGDMSADIIELFFTHVVVPKHF